eukprot:893440_1
MDNLILFHDTIDSLTDREFFGPCMRDIGPCMRDIGRELITTILFQGLVHELKNKNETNNAQKVNQIISNICQKREEVNPEISTEAIKLDHLPYLMLNNVASFLKFRKLQQFEKVNRATFIGSRSSALPIAIHSLDSIYFAKLVHYCDHHLDSYLPESMLCRSVSFAADDLEKNTSWTIDSDAAYPWSDLKLFSHIRELILHLGDGDSEGDFCVIQERLETGTQKLSNLSTLRVKTSQKTGQIFHACIDTLLCMVASSTLHFLEISARFNIWLVQHNAHAHPEAAFISQLKGIAINVVGHDCTNIYDDNRNDRVRDIQSTWMYPFLSENLQSFHKTLHLFDDTLNGKFNRLEEICLPWLLCKHDINILNNQNLKVRRIFFNSVDAVKELLDYRMVDRTDEYKYDKVGMQLLMNKMIESLEYIGIDLNKYKSIEIASEIVNILYSCLKSMAIKKYQLKFRMHNIQSINLDDSNDMFAQLEILIHILGSKCLHFMFICSNVNVQPSKHIRDFLSRMKQRYVVHEAADKTQYNFVISNTGCNMNGYKEQWIMSCTHCQQKSVFTI